MCCVALSIYCVATSKVGQTPSVYSTGMQQWIIYTACSTCSIVRRYVLDRTKHKDHWSVLATWWWACHVTTHCSEHVASAKGQEGRGTSTECVGWDSPAVRVWVCDARAGRWWRPTLYYSVIRTDCILMNHSWRCAHGLVGAGQTRQWSWWGQGEQEMVRVNDVWGRGSKGRG